MKQFKSFNHEIKDLDEKGVVTFYFNSFNVEDSDGDITKEATFTKTVKEGIKRVKHFKNHNYTLTPGVIKELGTDSFGAWAKSQLILGTQLGRDTYEEYKAGAITEHSFGFDIIARDEKDKRVIAEAKLWEVSSLSHWGANEQTPVIDIKSRESLLSELDTLLKLQKGNFTDEYLKKLEDKIESILKHLKSLTEPGPSHTTSGEPINAVKYLLDNLKF